MKIHTNEKRLIENLWGLDAIPSLEKHVWSKTFHEPNGKGMISLSYNPIYEEVEKFSLIGLTDAGMIDRMREEIMKLDVTKGAENNE